MYPRLEYIMEGDTPSFLGLIRNGLAWHESPAYGGWGGRYVLYQPYGESRPIWTNNHDSRDSVTLPDGNVVCSDPATIWRWREHFQHDFAARMDWCVASRYEEANHNPLLVINGDAGKDPIRLSARPGDVVSLSAEGSHDPDDDTLAITWFVYPEAGTYQGPVNIKITSPGEARLRVPETDRPETIHVIAQAEDDGEPSLFAYRRVIVTVQPKE